MSTQVYTYTDKEKRDAFFAELRTSDDPNERKAVKFSGVEPMLGPDGAQLTTQTGFRRRVKITTPSRRKSGENPPGGLRRLFSRITGKMTSRTKVKRTTTPIEVPRWRSTWSVAHPIGEGNAL